MFLVWLGEQITERGIGNGISLIIFASIVSGLPSAVAGTLELARTGALSGGIVLILFVGAIAVTYFVVFVERGQRRITVNYAETPARSKNDGRPNQPSPVQVEHGRGYSSYICIESDSVPRQSWQLVRPGG